MRAFKGSNLSKPKFVKLAVDTGNLIHCKTSFLVVVDLKNSKFVKFGYGSGKILKVQICKKPITCTWFAAKIHKTLYSILVIWKKYFPLVSVYTK